MSVVTYYCRSIGKTARERSIHIGNAIPWSAANAKMSQPRRSARSNRGTPRRRFGDPGLHETESTTASNSNANFNDNLTTTTNIKRKSPP